MCINGDQGPRVENRSRFKHKAGFRYDEGTPGYPWMLKLNFLIRFMGKIEKKYLGGLSRKIDEAVGSGADFRNLADITIIGCGNGKNAEPLQRLCEIFC